jgi:hypothetical protein
MNNKATKTITTVVGILLAFAGFEHGLFEILQGYKPPDSNFIAAIGKEMQWWIHGSEDAFTLIPNYLITGICAVCVSISIMLWSLFCLHRRHAATVFLFLFILLVLVGGGIGFIPFFIVTWAYVTRMNKPLSRWEKWLEPGFRKRLAILWPYMLTAIVLCWLAAIEIAVFGYVPGIDHPDARLAICWSLLLAAFILINITYVSGFAGDIDRRAGRK